jgi:hypothetical protein
MGVSEKYEQRRESSVCRLPEEINIVVAGLEQKTLN